MYLLGGGWRARILGGIFFSLRKKGGLSLGKCIYVTSTSFLLVDWTTSSPEMLGPHHVIQRKEFPASFGHHSRTGSDQRAWNRFEMRLAFGWELCFRKSNDQSSLPHYRLPLASNSNDRST